MSSTGTAARSSASQPGIRGNRSDAMAASAVVDVVGTSPISFTDPTTDDEPWGLS
jgi:hypothetical protein